MTLKDINILLLGESGVGKSTFINAVVNYLHFKNYDQVENHGIVTPIPFPVTNLNEQNFYDRRNTATHEVKTYVFPIENGLINLRFIDTPALAKSVKEDKVTYEKIFAHLWQVEKLHSICYFMKPTPERFQVFEHFEKRILMGLGRGTCHNLMFVITHAGNDQCYYGNFWFENIFNPITCPKFYVDHRIFSYLSYKIDDQHYLDVRNIFANHWEKSSREFHRMILHMNQYYIKKPMLMKAAAVNEAKRLIVQVYQPLADITQLIVGNLHFINYCPKIENLQTTYEEGNRSYIPAFLLRLRAFARPITVCFSPVCAWDINLDVRRDATQDPRICHKDCFLNTNDLINNSSVIGCEKMVNEICTTCGCDYSKHKHVYYLAGLDVANIVNISKKKKKEITVTHMRKFQVEQELHFLIKIAAELIYFLQQNTAIPVQDLYEEYTSKLWIKNTHFAASNEFWCEEYMKNKKTLNKLILNHDNIRNAEKVIEAVHKLNTLKYTGYMFKQLMNVQRAPRNWEYERNCYIHPNVAPATCRKCSSFPT